MEVIVGEEEATSLPDAQLEDSGVNKTFVPVAWAAAYGRNQYAYFLKIPCIVFFPTLLPESLCNCHNLSPFLRGLETLLAASVSGVDKMLWKILFHIIHNLLHIRSLAFLQFRYKENDPIFTVVCFLSQCWLVRQLSDYFSSWLSWI